MFLYRVSPFEGRPISSNRSSGTLFNLPHAVNGGLCSGGLCFSTILAIFIVSQMAFSGYNGVIYTLYIYIDFSIVIRIQVQGMNR